MIVSRVAPGRWSYGADLDIVLHDHRQLRRLQPALVAAREAETVLPKPRAGMTMTRSPISEQTTLACAPMEQSVRSNIGPITACGR